MNIPRLLNSPFGKIIISVLLGLGLATLFRKACTNGSCLQFNGPVISEVDGKTYQFGEHCYKYQLRPTQCDSKRRTVEFDEDTHQIAKPESTDKSKNSWVPFM
jgi:hypothetical protein